jgi:hypothetical protein
MIESERGSSEKPQLTKRDRARILEDAARKTCSNERVSQVLSEFMNAGTYTCCKIAVTQK